jgi:hypothetical protein
MMTSRKDTKGKTKWHMRVYYLDSCNCDWGCPCQFNAKPTHGNCEGVGGIHITGGKYGNIKLDRLNLAWIASFPGPVHEGHGKASYYIDKRATEEQFDALSKIITGEAGGGPFAVYRTVIETSQEPKRARITFQEKGTRSQVKVEDDKIIAAAQLEPMRNPVTGKIHRAIIELPAGFESNRLETSSLKEMFADDGFLGFKYAGTYGSIQQASWKGP